MLNRINFIKMHGLGNDFIIINHQDLPINCNLQKLATQISDRQIGIGCDQFIIYNKKANYYQMTIYNQDGSSAKACGNVSRCLMKLAYNNFNQKNITINVAGREFNCCALNEIDFSVNMGKVSFHESWMPIQEKFLPIAERYVIELKEMICADIGNPHLVIFSTLSAQDKGLIGKKLQGSELFPEGINVNFASIVDDTIYLEVWERGTGFTLACGSGACATFAAAVKLGFVSNNAEVCFKLGKLKMSKQHDDIIMSGPAVLVAKGEFYYG